MARLRHRQSASVELNLTSMMDVVFLLIIFFILVTNFATADLPPMQPAEPRPSKATDDERPYARIVNVVPVVETLPDGETKTLRTADHVLLLGQKYPLNEVGIKALTARLKRIKQTLPDLEIDLRADRALANDQVEPVMKAITAAGISRINIVALMNRDGEQE